MKCQNPNCASNLLVYPPLPCRCIDIIPMMRFLITAVVGLLLVAAPAFAQTVPGPRVNLAFDRPQSAACGNPTVVNAWDFTYGSCYLPAGVNLGDPWITAVKVTFVGTTTVSSTVPRAQVVLETMAARCGTGPTPCLRISDLAAPVGPTQVSIRFVDAEGREGGPSAAVPFSGTAPTVPAAQTLRVVP